MATDDEDPVDAVTWMIRGHWVTLAIRAAIELGVLDRARQPDLGGRPGDRHRQRPVRRCSGWSASSPTSGSSRCPAPTAAADDLVTITAAGAP